MILEPGIHVETNLDSLAQSRAGRIGGSPQAGGRGGGGRAGAGRGAITPAQQGRAIYEQNCQLCHGNDLRGSVKLEDVVARLGQTRVRETITQGRADMPSFSAIPEASMTALLLFLGNPSGVAAKR